MKKIIALCCFFVTLGVIGQDNTKKKDTIETEVVEIETRYNPKIADASKIVKQPTITILERSKRQKLKYSIFSAPVASTFVPKTGVVKGIDVGVKERIFNNYVALGYGNYASPYGEVYLHYNNKFNNTFGFHTRYNASMENIQNTTLNSTFSNTETSVFYTQKERFYKWKVFLGANRSEYNWYGLPNLVFAPLTIDQIQETQSYNTFKLGGSIEFEDSKVETVTFTAQYLTDAWDSSELYALGTADFKFPVDFLLRSGNAVKVGTSLEYLRGRFEQSYAGYSPVDHHFITLQANPTYDFSWGDLAVRLGTKVVLSMNLESDQQHFLIYPDVKLQFPLVKDFVSLYGGVSGGLTTNSYASFSGDNPFVSPTLLVAQTNETYNAFAGINALATNDLSIHLGINRKNEEDKPLFVGNPSKSDGATTTYNGIDLKGFEYGNSFSVVYDDVVTTSFRAELEYEASKFLSISTSFQYHLFDLRNQAEAWNLANTEATLLAKYKKEKWYATATVNYMGDRKDLLHSGPFPNQTLGNQTVSGFIDANLNGGYHINEKFTAFLKLNNILNADYQQFVNFNVQGFQALMGISYKFDF